MIDGARLVGRYLLLDPINYNQFTGRSDARLGMPEAVDREDVWNAIFEHATGWAREHGASRLVGPQHFTPMDGSGVLVDGFGERASMTMMPWHPPRYHKAFEAAGFTKVREFVSARLEASSFVLPDKVLRVAEIAERRSGMRIEFPRSRRHLYKLAHEIGELYNASWSDHQEFRPLTARELRGIAEDLAVVADPRNIPVLRGSRDELAGFILPFPDVTPALQRSSGLIGIRTLLDVRRERARTKHFVINGIGILPEYRSRGGTALLYRALYATLSACGATSAEMTQIADTTDLMLRDIELLGARIHKRHRVYEKALESRT